MNLRFGSGLGWLALTSFGMPIWSGMLTCVTKFIKILCLHYKCHG